MLLLLYQYFKLITLLLEHDMQLSIKDHQQGIDMQIAIPTDYDDAIYQDNAYTAPKFAIYTVVPENEKVVFFLKNIVENPLRKMKSGSFDEAQLKCSCDTKYSSELTHIYEHYSLLDSISGCSYLLANCYCKNVARSMKSGGIIIYKIPSIIKQTDTAIKNFLIGASFANTSQQIHHAS